MLDSVGNPLSYFRSLLGSVCVCHTQINERIQPSAAFAPFLKQRTLAVALLGCRVGAVEKKPNQKSCVILTTTIAGNENIRFSATTSLIQALQTTK